MHIGKIIGSYFPLDIHIFSKKINFGTLFVAFSANSF